MTTSRQSRDVENMMIDLKINPDISDEMQDMLYDQLSQDTMKELLAHVQMSGREQSLESLRKAMAYRQEDRRAQHVHRALQSNDATRVRGDHAWSSWKTDTDGGRKDIAYLKDIVAYDFTDKTMVSILMELLCPMKFTERSP